MKSLHHNTRLNRRAELSNTTYDHSINLDAYPSAFAHKYRTLYASLLIMLLPGCPSQPPLDDDIPDVMDDDDSAPGDDDDTTDVIGDDDDSAPGDDDDDSAPGDDDDTTSSEQDQDGDGVLPSEGDCDNTDAQTYPGAEEVCDGLDNNCDSTVPTEEIDNDGDGFAPCEGDCDDTDQNIFPNSASVDVDNDGTPDECDSEINSLTQECRITLGGAGSRSPYRELAVADITGDGQPEVIGFNGSLNEIVVINPSTCILNTFPEPPGWGFVTSAPNVGYLDGSIKSIHMTQLGFSDNGGIIPVNPNPTHPSSYTLNGSSGLISSTTFDNGEYSGATSALGDIDMDGTHEIFISTMDITSDTAATNFDSYEGGLSAYTASGTLLWRQELSGLDDHPPVFQRFDASTARVYIDTFDGTHCFDAVTGNPEWTLPSLYSNGLYDSPTVDNSLNPDGFYSLVVKENDTLRVVDALTGTVMNTLTSVVVNGVTIEVGTTYHSDQEYHRTLLADIDPSNQGKEIVQPTRTGVNIWSHNPSHLASIDVITSNFIESSALTLADTNGNGEASIILGDTYGNIYGITPDGQLASDFPSPMQVHSGNGTPQVTALHAFEMNGCQHLVTSAMETGVHEITIYSMNNCAANDPSGLSVSHESYGIDAGNTGVVEF